MSNTRMRVNDTARRRIMTELTPVIKKIKEQVSEDEWMERIQDRQNSELPVSERCRENNIAPATYYRHLRKLRETIIEKS